MKKLLLMSACVISGMIFAGEATMPTTHQAKVEKVAKALHVIKSAQAEPLVIAEAVKEVAIAPMDTPAEAPKAAALNIGKILGGILG